MLSPIFATLLFAALTLPAADDYKPGPDSLPQVGVPKGEPIKGVFSGSKIFPGAVRDYTLYLPQQLDRRRPASLMVLQDGGGYSASTVFDNLIHKKEIPALIGVFVMHGRVKTAGTNALDRFSRSYEYDGLGSDYARFLLDELLPFLAVKDGVTFSTRGADRAIGGASSGAIAAFTATWERPDAFARVFSSIGTYVGLHGGNIYPTLIRKFEPKPIRVFLQDGSADHIYGGDWWMANQEMARPLVPMDGSTQWLAAARRSSPTTPRARLVSSPRAFAATIWSLPREAISTSPNQTVVAPAPTPAVSGLSSQAARKRSWTQCTRSACYPREFLGLCLESFGKGRGWRPYRESNPGSHRERVVS